MRGRRGSRILSSSSSSAHHQHSCNDDCMLSSDDESIIKQHINPLRQHPPSVYEEDYYPSSCGEIAGPSPALLSYGLELPSPLEDIPSYSSSSATSPIKSAFTRSWASSFKLPPLVAQTASRASLPSPTKTLSGFISSASPRDSSPQAGISSTGSSNPGSPTRQRSNPLSDWFVGSSAPLQLGQTRRDSASPTRSLGPLPEHQHPSSNYDDMVESYTASPTRRRGSTVNSTSAGTGLTSKLSWLAKSITSTTITGAAASPSAPPATSGGPDAQPPDELLTLDVTRALLPHGTPDILAPSSFHDLLSASEALLARYQTAYRAKCATAAELTAEQSAQAEELEGAEMRARHLKMQLDGMAEKARAQEEAMRQLSAELHAERRRSVQLAQSRQNDDVGNRRRGNTSSSSASGASVVTTNSDSGFESDADSAVDTASVVGKPGHFRSGSSTTTTLVGGPDAYSPPPHSPTSRYQDQPPPQLVLKMAQARRSDVASAWAALEGFREENRALRERVRDLEGAVEGCLDMVAGLGA